jgi:CheY-like chemotaxis protein
VVNSAERALVELDREAGRFAAVFSDVVMGGMSGIELAREIGRRHGALPVVLSSGYSAVLAQNPDHGFTLLPKPYALDDLARVLHDAIQPPRPPATQPRKSLSHLQNAVPVTAAPSEPERLAELASLRIMDSDEDAAYDELTRLAAEVCQTPIALISLVDDDRQWFKSKVGLQARQTPREHAFCAHAIQDPNNLLIVPDATQDSRFAANPLVTGAPHIRFYAGAPLVTSNGQPLGTLCVIDREPRQLQPGQLEVLQLLASQVIQRLEAQRAGLNGGTEPA